jgi:hypothetical protein
MRQVEHHRRRTLGAGRIESVRTARRVDAGRDLQRLHPPQAGSGRASVELVFDNSARQGGRAVGPVRRDRRQAHPHARRHLDLLHQRPAGAPARHPGHLPRHRPRPARLRHHRPGHDLAHHRIAPGRAARVPRGSGGRLEVQGAAPRDRKPPVRHPRKPAARRRHPARAERQPGQARSPGRGRQPLPPAAGDQEEKQKLLWLLRKNEAKAEQTRWFREMEEAQNGLEEQTRSCATSSSSWNTCASTTTPSATACTRRRVRCTRPIPRSAAWKRRSSS